MLKISVMLLIFIFVISFLLINNSIAQKFTIYGTIKDSATGETLIGAAIQIRENKQQVSSNNYGFYSISLQAGNYSLSCT